MFNTTINKQRRTTNPLLKCERSIHRFLMSIIGPNTKKPIIAPVGNLLVNPLAINASEVEQAENKNAANIINNKEKLSKPCNLTKKSEGSSC